MGPVLLVPVSPSDGTAVLALLLPLLLLLLFRPHMTRSRSLEGRSSWVAHDPYISTRHRPAHSAATVDWRDRRRLPRSRRRAARAMLRRFMNVAMSQLRRLQTLRRW